MNDDKLYLHVAGSCSAPPTGSAWRTRTFPTRSESFKGCPAFQATRPPPAGFLGLPVPRARADPSGGLLFTSGLRAGGGRSSIGDGCSTTAAARVASSALGSPQLRPTSPGRRSVYRDRTTRCCFGGASTSTPMARSSTSVIERARAPADPVSHPDPLGPRRSQRLRESASPGMRFEHAPARCCCTRPSATIRSRTGRRR